MTQVVAEADAFERALELLARGELVAIPTETVYGLAADAADGEAVAKIFEAKGRPRFNPLIAHVCDFAMAERLARFDPLSRELAERFWPGPLTLVLPLAEEAPVHGLVTAGLPTIALRMPVGFGSRLIAALGRPLAAPSANRSGRITGTTAEAVARDLDGRVTLVVDGGATPVGVESTILKVEGDAVLLLRPGGVPADAIEAAAGRPLTRRTGGAVQAPGMLRSHYAPAARLRLDVANVRPGEALLAFGPRRARGSQTATALRNLSPSGDLREAAARLFEALGALDRSGAAMIAVEPIPRYGLGEAINDRLQRAAAPRPEDGDLA